MTDFVFDHPDIPETVDRPMIFRTATESLDEVRPKLARYVSSILAQEGLESTAASVLTGLTVKAA